MAGDSTAVSSKKIALALVVIGSIAAALVIWNGQREKVAFEIFVESAVPGELILEVSSQNARDLKRLGRAISELPEKVPSLSAVRILDLHDCPQLRSLAGASKFESLETLIATECPELESVEGIESLGNLSELVLNDCPKFSNAATIRTMPELEILDLSGAKALSGLDLASHPNIASVFLSGCESLESLNLTACANLRRLSLDGCRSLKAIDGLGELSALTDLDLSSCHALEHLNGVPGLESLVVLDLRNVIGVANFDDVGKVANLEVIRLGGQPQLKDLSMFSGLSRLREIHIEGCENLASLDGLPGSVSDYAGFTYCPELSSISALGNAPEIQRLDLAACPKIADVSVLKKLKSLRNLNLSGCRGITDVSVLESLDHLGVVQLGGSGVAPAAVASLQEKLPEAIFDFSGGGL